MYRSLAVVPPLALVGLVLYASRDRGAEPADPPELIATISTGEHVELARYLVPGRRTVFEYTADW